MSEERQLNFVNNLNNRIRKRYYIDNNSEINDCPLEENMQIYSINDNQLYQVELNDYEEDLEGKIINFTGRNNTKIDDLKVNIEPVQDLHGQDTPYPAGSGKNLLQMTVDYLKSHNTGGTWTENKYALNSVEFTILTDNAGNVNGINVNGTASANTTFYVGSRASLTVGTSYTFSGSPSDGDSSTYCMRVANPSWTAIVGNRTLTLAESTTNGITIYVTSGTVCNNKVFTPMCCLSTASNPTTFAPYSNICPISSFTGCNVRRTGKNLIDDSIKYRQSAATVAIGNEYAYTIVLKAGTYTFSVEFLNGAYAGAYIREKNGTSNTAIWTSTSMRTSASFTLASDGLYRIWLNNSNGLSASNIGRCQLEYGSTATVYEAYAGTVVPISWQSEAGTIYGGTLDVTTGVLTVDKVKFSQTFGEMSTRSDTVPAGFVLKTSERLATGCDASKAPLSAICNVATYNANANNRNVFRTTSSGNYLYFTLPTEMDSSTVVEAVYPIATPQTYQLTAQQLNTLLGDNNIWSDIGTISATISDKGLSIFNLDP